MASSDLRDVFNLPHEAGGVSRPSKKLKTSVPRPNLKGLAREVQSLGGDTPISLIPELSVFKRRRIASKKPAASWELRPFRNSARDDPLLVLYHWRRKTEKPQAQAAQQHEGAAADGEATPGGGGGGGGFSQLDLGDDGEMEDSSFAKFNVKIPMPEYTDDQYSSHLQNEDWSRHETDYLMSVIRDYELRWPLIWDRYDYSPPAVDGETAPDGSETKVVLPVAKPRSLEDLKKRYYTVAAKVMELHKPVDFMTQQEFEQYSVMANFNPAWEKRRKTVASNAMSRKKEEVREEEMLLLELRRIQMREEKFNQDRRELFQRLDFPYTEQDISPYRTSAGLATLLQNLAMADKVKKRKSIVTGDGASPSTAGLQSAGVAPESSRRDSIATSVRDSAAPGPTPTSAASNRKGSQYLQQQQQYQQLHQQQQMHQQQLQQQQQQQQQMHQQPERQKLTEQEEILYGVTHHDRLGAGPTFRSEKINKLFNTKSNTQHLRITNTLNELDIPPRLIMPTASVTTHFEQLLGAVNSLLELRKQADKAEADLKVELRKKEDREAVVKTQAAAAAAAARGGASQPKGGQDADGDIDMADGLDATDPAGTTDAGVPRDSAGSEEGEREQQASYAAAQTRSNGIVGGDARAGGREGAQAEVDEDYEDDEEEEDGDDVDADADGSAKGPTNKRSASVLSASSDKSTKRQKK